MNVHKTQVSIDREKTSIHYTIYKKNDDSQRKILFIPGSRLGGLETFESLVDLLGSYSEIIISEIRGAGPISPLCTSNNSFTIADLMDDLFEILEQENWSQFNVVGYSFGGLLSMLLKETLKKKILNHVIIESALLAESDARLLKLADELDQIATIIEHDPEEGNDRFTQLVVPQNKIFPAFENPRRTIYNPLGFSNLLSILSHSYRTLDRWALILNQDHITSILSEYAPEGTQAMMQCIESRCPSWKIEHVKGCGHGFIMSKPKKAASIIEKVLNF